MGLAALVCFKEDLDMAVGDEEGERCRLLRSVAGDLRDVDLDAKAGEGERRIRGGEGV